MIELLLLPLLVGCLVALISAPLGAFVMWNRLVYFGDTLAHSALLGVAFALLFSLTPSVGIALSCIVIAVLLWLLQKRSRLANDSLLGIISHSSLALGLVCVSLMADTRIDLHAYLFGDLLTVTMHDAATIAAIAVIIFIGVGLTWRGLLMMTIDQHLAQVEGVQVERLRLLLMVFIALLIGIAMKVVGILLITALLIIPAASARKVTRSPEAMVIVAALIALSSVCLGLAASYFFDTPPGASIVLSGTCFFITTQCLAKR